MCSYSEIVFSELRYLIPTEIKGLHVRQVAEDVSRQISQRIVRQAEVVHQV